MDDERDLAESPVLRVDGLSIAFGGVRALDGVSFTVQPGRTFSVIGPNGAGKSTLFNCLSRLYRPSHGTIYFRGVSLLARRPHQVADLGIGRTFQNTALFRTMTVAENLMVGAQHWAVHGLGPAVLRTRRLRRSERAVRSEAVELLDYLDLMPVAERQAGGLDFPTQKRIELGRALMSRPSLLLLDEPAGGLNLSEVGELTALLERLRADFSLTLMLVEHRMNMVMRLSDDVLVLDSGRVIASGPPAEVQWDPAVIAAYLGERAARQLRTPAGAAGAPVAGGPAGVGGDW